MAKNKDIQFILTVADHEPLGMVKRCVDSIKAHYEGSIILTIADGEIAKDVVDFCRANTVFFQSEHLKRKQRDLGAAWWERFFLLSRIYKTKWVVKIDADTIVHGKISYFPAVAMFGTVLEKGFINEHVIGGFQFILSNSIALILHSGLCTGEALKGLEWMQGTVGQDYIDRGELSTDHSLMFMLRKLNLQWASHREICITSSEFDLSTLQSWMKATHKHKFW
ncbi:MAG TPA: hypothetical protein VK559_08155 [Ferruginibacter sp.]|nr:hypothetical protein [Ferruginibacter sp.]